MSHPSRPRRAPAGLLALTCAATLTAFACGSGKSSSLDGPPSSDGATPGLCSADVPAGQACNMLVNIATAITPTCVTGTMPTATGGTIVDGTYVLASQTYYNAVGCSSVPIRETITISGGCIQAVAGDILSATGSSIVMTQGNTLTGTSTCTHFDFDASSATRDAPVKTFTATATTFTIFDMNSSMGSPNPDRVEIFTKQ